MTRSNDRPVSVLDRRAEPGPPVQDRPLPAPAAVPSTRQTAAAGQDAVSVTHGAAGAAPVGKPLARGWGSHEERRLMLWGLVGFFLLGVYATAFVVLGAVVWT